MSSPKSPEKSSQSGKRKSPHNDTPSKDATHIPLELCPEEEIFSPKKKSKIALRMLKTKITPGSPSRIGSVLKLPEACNGAIRKGEVRNVRIVCTVTENRTGRMPGHEAVRSGRRFIYIADCTGVMSIGMVASDTGISKFDVAESECKEGTRCFFNAVVTGDIAWIPTRKCLDSPTFFLNNGKVEKIEDFTWEGFHRFMFPTTDVCRQMVKSKFADTACFTTTGICGKVDICSENSDGDVVISLEDPVGYVAVEIELSDEGDTAENFIKRKGLAQGIFVFFKGAFAVGNFETQDNAVLKIASEGVDVTLVQKPFFEECTTALCDMDTMSFPGNIPEYM